MKKLYVLLIILLSIQSVYSQRIRTEYETDSKWFISLNAGGIWHTSDVKNKTQIGWGFGLGRSFNYNYGTPISFDLRMRYLRGFWVGQDRELSNVSMNDEALNGAMDPAINYYKPDTATIVRNFQNDQHRIGLELAIHANGLRERTGLDLYVFGGIGFTWWQVYGDVLNNTDTANAMYNYAGLTDFSNSSINALQDGTYDTPLQGSKKTGYNVTWMPSVGFGIAYQVGPRFQVGIEHKTTFTRTDLWDGKNYNDAGELTGQNDIYHYTSLNLKFNLRKINSRPSSTRPTPTTPTPTPPVTTNPTPTPTCISPTISVSNPIQNYFTTDVPNMQFRADITGVDGAHQISFKQNGQFNTNFTYNAALGRLDSYVVLKPGQNNIEIVATNACGTYTESRVIILQTPTIAPPIVSYQNPPYSPYSTENPIFPLDAQVLNVTSQAQVTMTYNGMPFSGFNFNPQTGKLNAQLSLVEGNNTVTITGTNQAGTDSKQTIIFYKKQQLRQPPVVNFVNPVQNPIEVDQPQASILATVLNVDQQQNISVRVNGQALPLQAFSFSKANNMTAFTANLVEGANVISVRGVNEVGMDEKSTTIIYRKAVVEYPPIVTFIDPFENPKTVNNPSYLVRTRIQNVSTKSQIAVWVNNVQTSNFTYNNSSQEVQLQVGLNAGANLIRVRGTNNAGMDEKTTTIIYRPHNPINPPIVDITSPQGNPAEVSVPSSPILATVLNVNTYQQIQVFVNGQAIQSFNFNTQNHTVSFNAQLNEGMNTVKVTGTNEAGFAEDVQQIRYTKQITIAPPIVTFTNPNPSPQTVQNVSYEMRATVQNISDKNQLQVRHNGQLINPSLYTYNHQTKEVRLPSNLVLGSNIFEVVASNIAGIDSKNALVIYEKIEVPCDKPTIVFNQPTGTITTVEAAPYNLDITITGITSQNDVSAKLNGSLIPNITYSSATQKLTGAIVLAEGFNAIEIIAANTCGTASANSSIQFTLPAKPCLAPELTRVNPVNATAQVQQDAIQVSAVGQNIANASELKLFVNGTPRPFTYDVASHVIGAEIALEYGMNEIRFAAETACGKAQVVWNIEKMRCDQPVLNLSTSSGANNTTDNPIFNINGNIQNVEIVQGVSITHNGTGVNFNFNPATDQFNANINLVEGNNIIVVNAKNNCGNNQKTYTIVYKPAVVILPPVVDITNPANTPFTTEIATMTVIAAVQHVSEASQISVTVNGTNRPFNFNSATLQVQINSTWVEGANVIVVTATNEAGAASDTKTVIYRKPVVILPPVITFTNPILDPHTVDVDNYTVTGFITNISAMNQVQGVLNNMPFAQFNPSIANGQMNFSIPLTFDNIHTEYTIQFTATNVAGSDQASRTIIRKKVEVPTNCMPQVGATFSSNNESAVVSSTKDLSNVVVKFHDNTTQKFDGLTGLTGTFSGTGTNAGKCIIGVWIKSGCNMSNDGPGYGEWVPNTKYDGKCNINQPCGPRINPGNSADQFCLITPSGTFNRNDLHNNGNFSYTGPASSAYFLSIAGGADVEVNGVPFPIQSGMYYLFTGNLQVDVRNNHPGAMGHWHICIKADAMPQSGNGNNRPKSPCSITIPPKPVDTPDEPETPEPEDTKPAPNCLPQVSGRFSEDHLSVTTISDKDLSNVVLKFHDNTTQKFDNLSGKIRSFSGTGANEGKCIVGVWIKSGCNMSNDGPGYGEWVPNTNYNGVCAINQPCGPRINPGNSAWQFCLVTPSGTFTRTDLHNNANFSYTGPASSAYFMPIAGGADVEVNGAPYKINSGRYYLFNGNMEVDVRNNHPGAMGHWQICIKTDAEPQSGNGNNRPVSPCEGNSQQPNKPNNNSEDKEENPTTIINRPGTVITRPGQAPTTTPVPNNRTTPQPNNGTLTRPTGGAVNRPRP